MARLVPFALQEGTLVEIRGALFRCEPRNLGSTTIFLAPISGEAPIEISRNELASLLVTEEARVLDELEEPEPTPRRTCTDITGLSIFRVLEWQLKMHLCRVLMPYAGHSPKSPAYRAVFEAEGEAVRDLYQAAGLTFEWSIWTVYHDLLRWRASGYDIAALQRKGVEYTPWDDDKKVRTRKAREVMSEILKSNPNLSASAVHREVNKRLRMKGNGGELG